MANAALNLVNAPHQPALKAVDLGDASFALATSSFDGMAVPPHDYIAMSYDGSNLETVEYYVGGAEGELVATITLGYNESDQLISVTRS